MKILINFGLEGPSRQIIWNSDHILGFPKLLRYNGKKWEWFMYDVDITGPNDYKLIFSELPTYDPNFYVDMVSFEDLFGYPDEKCECGGTFLILRLGSSFLL
jgi:hypothetical protein